jgi:hypothetical protein
MTKDNAASIQESTPEPVLKPPASMSLFRYSPGLILVAVAIADSIRLPDPDLWGHVRFGQAVLNLHHLVLLDPYSYSAAGHYWNNHEWLSEVLLAAVFNHAGAFGLILLKLGCTAVVIIALAAALAETGSSTLVQFAVLVGSAVVIKPQLQFRPQSFTFALLAVLIYLLTRDAYRRTGRLWLAIPILALWANLHGGFIMGCAWHLQRGVRIPGFHRRARLSAGDETGGDHLRVDRGDARDAVRNRNLGDRRTRIGQSIYTCRDPRMATARVRSRGPLAAAPVSHFEL